MERPAESSPMIQVDGESVVSKDSLSLNDLLVSITFISSLITYLNVS